MQHTVNGKRLALVVSLIGVAMSFAPRSASQVGRDAILSNFSFAVTADVRGYAGPGQYDAQQYFRGACEAIAAAGEGAFMVSPGDLDPPANVEWTIGQYVGQSYLWYPVVGNHDIVAAEDIAWLRAFDRDPNGSDPPDVVNDGPPGCPETTYSFDYGNAHFIVLNEYCDAVSDTATDGDVPDVLYNWLADDLSATDKQHVFVFGHEPAYPQPDADNGRPRHVGDSLDGHPANRDRFWNLLQTKGVVAYICGHTHNYSAIQVGGVWQLDVGHAQGQGDPGAPSTFVVIHVAGDAITFEVYRDDANSDPYSLTHSGVLAGKQVYLPVVMRAYP
jgi:hypothetical protein